MATSSVIPPGWEVETAAKSSPSSAIPDGWEVEAPAPAAPGLIPRVTSRVAYAGIDEPPAPAPPAVPQGVIPPPTPIGDTISEPNPRFSAISQQMANNPPPGSAPPKLPVPWETDLTENLPSDQAPGLITGKMQTDIPQMLSNKFVGGLGNVAQGIEGMAAPAEKLGQMIGRNQSPGAPPFGPAGAPLTPEEGSQLAKGAHQTVSGVFDAATPFMLEGALTAPLKTAAVLAPSIAAQEGVAAGLEHLGLPPEYAAVAGDLAGILAGSIAHKYANFHTMESVKAELQKRWIAHQEAQKPPSIAPSGSAGSNGSNGTVSRETHSSGPQQTPIGPAPPTKSETVSAATPNPPTAATPTAVESDGTRAIQMQQLGQGVRRVVMFTKGQGMPAEYPPNVAVTHDDFGNTYAYRTDLITKGEIHSAARNNQLPTVLGGPNGTGAPDKSALPPDAPVVAVHAPDGTEVQATATTPEAMGPTLVAHQPLVPPGGSIGVTNTSEILNGRNGHPPSGITGEGRPGESFIEQEIRRARGFRPEDSADLGPQQQPESNAAIAAPPEITEDPQVREHWLRTVIDGVQQHLLNMRPGETVVIPAGEGGIEAVRAWAAAGFPADGADSDMHTLTSDQGIPPGQMLRIDPGTLALSVAPDAKEGGLFLVAEQPQVTGNQPETNLLPPPESPAVSTSSPETSGVLPPPSPIGSPGPDSAFQRWQATKADHLAQQPKGRPDEVAPPAVEPEPVKPETIQAQPEPEAPKPETPKGPIRRTDTQLKEAALARAEEEGDAKNLKLFKKIKPKAMTVSQRGMLNEYMDRPPKPQPAPAPPPSAPPAPAPTPEAGEPPPARDVPPPMGALVSNGTGLFNRPKYLVAQTITGTKVRFRWIIRNAPDVLTSFREGYDQELQPRQMDRADAEVKVNHLMTKGEPEALKQNWQIGEGAPVESADNPNMVEIGNHRAEAIVRSYERGGQLSERYRPSIIEDADLYGFDPAEVEKIPEPVLLRQRLTEMEPAVRRKYLEDANARSTNAMSPAEQAAVDSRNLLPIMGLLSPSESGDLLAASNRPFLDAFAKMVPASEMGNYRDKEGNAYLPSFADRVQNAILAVAYGDPTVLERIMESKDDNVKIATNAMVQAAPDIAAIAKFAKANDLDLGKAIAEATEMLSGLRNRKGKFATIYEDWKNQVKIEDKPDRNLLMQMIVDYGRATSRLGNVLKIYAREIAGFEADLKKKEEYGEVDMFGNPLESPAPPSRLDLIAQAIRSEGEEYERSAEAKAERAKSRNGGDAGEGPKISGIPRGARGETEGLGDSGVRTSSRPSGWESVEARDLTNTMKFEPIELTGKDADRAVAVRTNSDGMAYLKHATASGVHFANGHARNLVQYLDHQIGTYTEMGLSAPRGLVALRDIARQAATTEKKSLVFVDDRPNATHTFEKTLRHELDHAIQAQMKGKRPRPRSDAEAARAVTNHPLYKKAETYLRSKFPGYEKASAGAIQDEVGVRLMQTGHHVDMGLTIEEARTLAASYVKTLRGYYERLSAKEIADRVFPALRKGQPAEGVDSLRPTGGSGAAASRGANPPEDDDFTFIRQLREQAAADRRAATGTGSGVDRVDDSPRFSFVKDFLDDEEGAWKGVDTTDVKAKWATRQAALQAIKDAEASPLEKKWGTRIIEWHVGERDSWVAKVNQEISKLKKALPDETQQQALSLMRDYKNKRGELVEWLTDKHANQPVPKPAKIVNGKKVAEEVTPEMATEFQSRIDKLKPAMRLALSPTPEMDAVNKRLDVVFEVALLTGKKLGILDSKITPEEYITHIFNPKDEGDIPIPLSNRVARAMGGKIGRKFAYSNKRGYSTILDAVADGVRPRTLNAFDATTIYSDKFATRRATQLFVNLLRDAGIGKWGQKTKGGKIPEDWIQFAGHSPEFRNLFTYPNKAGEPAAGEQWLYVPKFIDDAMRPITDPNYLSRVPFFMGTHMYQQWVKTANLALSFFHPKALEMMALSNMGAVDTVRAHAMDLEGAFSEEKERELIRATGITDILHRTQEAYHNLAPGTMPTLGDVLAEAPGMKQLNTFAKGVTHTTFGVMQRKFKIWDFARQTAAWDANHPNATTVERLDAQRSIAKQVNAVYGGLNWEVLGMNKAALALSRMLILAPDWTYSNFINVGQSFEGGPKAMIQQLAPKFSSKKWEGSAAGGSARLFWIRAMLGGMLATQMMSIALTGTRSKRWTQVYMGKDKDGNEIYQNLFFSGAPGDLVNIISKSQERGVINGAGRWLAGKYSPIIRAYETAHTGETYLGTKINQPGMSPVAQDIRTLGYMGRDLAPVPFSLMNAWEMAFGPKKDIYTPAEFIGTLVGGTPPQHVAPEGFKKTAAGLKPVAEKENIPFWRQVLSGKTHETGESGHAAAKAAIEKAVRAGEDPTRLIQQAIKDGLINQQDASSARRKARESTSISAILHSTMPRAIALYDQGSTEDRKQMEPFMRSKLLRARNKPWEWDGQTKRLAKQYFNIDAPKP